jgi:hypothetical protein
MTVFSARQLARVGIHLAIGTHWTGVVLRKPLVTVLNTRNVSGDITPSKEAGVWKPFESTIN